MTPESAGCQPELVTGWVDDALDTVAADHVAAHVATCDDCRTQADAERRLKARLRAEVPLVMPAPSLAPRIQSRLRERRSFPVSRVLLPIAATFLLAFGWARSTPSFLAWELARDHRHCFGQHTVPAKVWTNDARVASSWFEGQGTEMPWLPDAAGRLQLVGARYCPLPGLSQVAHLYYAGESGEPGADGPQLSVYVVDRPLLLEDEAVRVVGVNHVLIRRKSGRIVAIVSPEKKDVESLEDALDVTVARLGL